MSLSLALDQWSGSSNLMQVWTFTLWHWVFVVYAGGVWGEEVAVGTQPKLFSGRVVALSIIGQVAFSHTPACMLCRLSGLCETLNQEAKMPTNGLLCACWHPESVRPIKEALGFAEAPVFSKTNYHNLDFFVYLFVEIVENPACEVIFVSVSLLFKWPSHNSAVSPFKMCSEWNLH